MKLSQKELLEIVRLIERSRFEACELQVGDFKLTLSNHPIGPPTLAMSAPEPERKAQEYENPQLAPSAKPPARQSQLESDPELQTIDAPVVGIFYRSPEPGAPPFVGVGSCVDEDTTVGLVEVMKVFNAVKAGVRGTVEAVYAEDQQLVEYGETIMVVRPEKRAQT